MVVAKDRPMDHHSQSPSQKSSRRQRPKRRARPKLKLKLRKRARQEERASTAMLRQLRKLQNPSLG
eukprot:10571826-Karenia_brevis.AAC.1